MHVRLIDFYWVPLILIAVVIFLINKRTRKVTLKILLGIAIMIFDMFIIFLLGMLFFRDNLMIFFTCSFFTSIIVFMFGVSLKELIRIIRIKRTCCTVAGEIFDIGYGRGSCYKIRYCVKNQEYVFTAPTLSQGEKWKVGDSVTVIYSSKNPHEAYMKKNDSVAAIALMICSAFLLIGAIVVECYALTAA